jgi:hypothetical protein
LPVTFPQTAPTIIGRSTFLKELSDEVIDLIVEHGNRMESPLSRIVIQFFGAAAGRVGPADTAFAQRQAEYM